MNREKLFLQLLSDDLCALHASALALENDWHRISLEIQSHKMDSLTERIGQINCSGFAPIKAMLTEAGVTARPGDQARAAQSGVLADTELHARRADTRRLGTSSAISIMRRSARYMELYCSSIADSALRLRLDDLASHLRAWARDWIGLELTLNSVAASPRDSVRAREETAYAA